ncbi:Hypothetical predicted protein [Pelobates cultripes]|uniref:Helix-turn-helix domain-containing protein n=1 Tax=Pelobates cultripes TaxID=61616 RepID=A0AAD1SZI8_PELCU|nr:Hypothetical predicted protein [Pelobates cultripes]
MAPMYANGYMYIFEQENILTPFQTNIAFYRRYVDDIIMIWNGTPDSTTHMLETINNLDTPVPLTMTTDTQTVDFLDIRLYKEDNTIAYTLFSKPTDRNTILHATSHHRRHLINSLPHSQFLRVIRNNSNINNTHIQLQQMWDKFKARGYSNKILQAALDKCYVTSTTELSKEETSLPIHVHHHVTSP